MNDHLDPCKLFWCHIAEQGADADVSGTVPGRLDHLIGCFPCRTQFSDLVARGTSLHAKLEPPKTPGVWSAARVGSVLDAMRRVAQGHEPGEEPGDAPGDTPGEEAGRKPGWKPGKAPDASPGERPAEEALAR